MPMGFYQPAQIVIDAKNHGVELRPVDINYSTWDNALEERVGRHWAVRLGFRQVKGLREEDMIILTAGRGERYENINQLKDAGVSEAALERLADADAFRSIGLDRRKAIWEVSALADRPEGMFKGQSAAPASEQQIELPGMSLSEHVIRDYGSTGLSLKAHPVSFVRDRMKKLNIRSTADLAKCKNGMYVKVAGLVLVRQRPGTAGGVCFITIEDETGVSNLVVFEQLFQKYRKEIVHSHLLMVEGRVQIEGEVIHVIVKRCYDLSVLLRELTQVESDKQPVQTLSRADEKDDSVYPAQNKETRVRKMVQGEIFPGGRNFK
jgi:error-prone DNA polymerase